MQIPTQEGMASGGGMPDGGMRPGGRSGGGIPGRMPGGGANMSAMLEENSFWTKFRLAIE